VRRNAFIGAILIWFCAIDARAQGFPLDLGGERFQCREGWDFDAGGVQAHFGRGQLTGAVTQAGRFEVSPACGGTSLVISFSGFVKNVRMRVATGAFAVRVVGAINSVNPPGGFATVTGPTSSIAIFSSGEGGFTVDMISFELGDQPALFAFIGSPTDRVLTHKYRSDDAYPSAMQTEDGKIRVEGFVHDLAGLNGVGGRAVYFRLIDPPDSADYVVKNGDAHAGDNVDGPGTLNGSNTATAVSDGAGKVSVTLGITDHAAGDNYQIEAALDPGFLCTPAPCRTSMVYTAWKRVYVEVHKMFRVGAFITANVNPGDKRIVVGSTKGFPSPPYTIRLIHAGKVEEDVPEFYSEDVRVVGLKDHKMGTALLMEGQGDPAVPGVAHRYVAEDTARDTPRPYLADAIAVIAGDRRRDYFLPNGTFVNRVFEEAFVEHVWLTDSVPPSDKDLLVAQPRLSFVGVLPFRDARIGEADEWEREWLARKWLRNATRHSKGERRAKPNHQALFVAPKHQYTNVAKTEWLNGIATVADEFNDTWLFVDEVGMRSSNNLRGEAAVHELAHQWLVNPTPQNAAQGHCNLALPGNDQRMYDHHDLQCTMTSHVYNPSNAESSDGIVGFHYYVKAGQPRHSEYLHIRRRPEPVPQNERMGVRKPK
jgi:hypothetical protein